MGRVRVRQLAVVAGIATVLAVVAVPLALAPRLFQHELQDEGSAGPPVTSTVSGVSITYPGEWTLLQLNDRLEIGGTETSSLFQLSNFDPLENNVWVCPLPSGRIPQGGLVLYTYEILEDQVSAPAWPVDLEDGRAINDTCARRVARWQVDGRTFEAGAVGDLDGSAYGELVAAFRSMSFGAPDDDPPLGTDNVTVDHAYVVASGREGGEPWNLLAFRYRDVSDNVLCLLFDAAGPPEGRCEPNPIQNDLDFVLSAEPAGGTLFAFGTAPASAARVETLDGRSLQLQPLPEGLRIPFQAFVGPADELVADGAQLVEVRLVDAGGDVVDRRQSIEPMDEGVPGVKAFDHAFGELWWLFDDGEQILLKTRDGVTEMTGGRLLPEGEHLQVWTHTFTQETDVATEYETIVFGLSSGEGTQVTLLLTTGEALHASLHSLEQRGPDLIVLSHIFWTTISGAVRGEVVALDTGCRVLARLSLHPDTPAPPLPSPPPEPDLECLGP